MCTFLIDEVTSDLINAARKIRHTLGGAFSPTTDICEILVGGLEKVCIKPNTYFTLHTCLFLK